MPLLCKNESCTNEAVTQCPVEDCTISYCSKKCAAADAQQHDNSHRALKLYLQADDIAQQDPGRAIKLFCEAIELAGEEPGLVHRLGVAYLDDSRKALALEKFNRALELLTENDEDAGSEEGDDDSSDDDDDYELLHLILYDRAQLYQGREQWRSAEADLRRIVAIESTASSTTSILARTDLGQLTNDLNESKALFEKGLELLKENEDAATLVSAAFFHLQLAHVHIFRREWPAAIARCQLGLKAARQQPARAADDQRLLKAAEKQARQFQQQETRDGARFDVMWRDLMDPQGPDQSIVALNKRLTQKAVASASRGGPAAAACQTCQKSGVKLSQCSRCLEAAYCSAQCQKKHWPEHKQMCKKTETYVRSAPRQTV